MGAWGPGLYDNDDAQDWIYEFAAQGVTALDAALDATETAHEAGYVETGVGTRALASGDVIALVAGQGDLRARPEGLRNAVEDHREAVARRDDLTGRALRLVGIVMGDPKGSELAGLWDEAAPENLEAWRQVTEDLRARLEAAETGAGR